MEKMVPTTQPMIVYRRCGGASYINSPDFGSLEARECGVIRAKFLVNCSRAARCRDCVSAVLVVSFEGGGEACSWPEEALRRCFDANFRGEEVFALVEQIRFVSKEVRVRFCWLVMHLRHMGSLNGVRAGRSQAPLNWAIVFDLYTVNQYSQSRNSTWRTCDPSTKNDYVVVG